MTSLRPSGSSSAETFGQLHPGIQRWIYDQGWPSLRPIQSLAIPPILSARRDVIITAGTAGGKTEAAWLPICSALAFDEDRHEARLGVKALMVSPLKALINDQADRLSAICERLDLPVNRRHGDVRGRERDALKENPDGLLLITPESLEALFVLNGPRVPAIFNGLRYVVIDELHAFIGSERGAQLQSLLHRIELASNRSIPRIALSATLADTKSAAAFLRPGGEDDVTVITDPDHAGTELRMQLRGYMEPGRHDQETSPAGQAIADHLFRNLRGTKNLVFANRRSAVETFADILSRESEERRVPNEFYAHHGSLSKEIREDVERLLKTGDMGATAICTSTLEMGIDIGAVTSVAQIGSPGSVASLRQRLGRSGRRGQPALLRVYVTEREIDQHTHPVDMIHQDLIESIAIIDLMLEHWLEPPRLGRLHLSTLVQQTLSVIAQNGGAHAQAIYRTLCQEGPFSNVSPAMFLELLRSLGSHDILVQASDGLLLPGEQGERLLNHYSFYAAFESADEYRLIAEGRTLGTLPIVTPIIPGTYLIFAGRRWEILSVDAEQKIIELRRASGGRVPTFESRGMPIAHGIRQRMKRVFESTEVPRYLNPSARQMLAEARTNYRLLQLQQETAIELGNNTLLFPWCGDHALATLQAMLATWGLKSTQNGVALEIEGTTPDEVRARFASILDEPAPDPLELAALVPDKVQEKHDRYLSESLLCEVTARRDFDVDDALACIRRMSSSAGDTKSNGGREEVAAADVT